MNVLEEAAAVIAGDRQEAYGSPEDSFRAISELWSVYLGETITPGQVGVMMILLKIARLECSPEHRDSFVDIAGYAAATARTLGIDEV